MKFKFYALMLALLVAPVLLSAQKKKDSPNTPAKEENEKKDKKKNKPADTKPGNQEMATRTTDDGKLNGYELSFTQGAYEFDGSTVQIDTIFQLHSGFVIDLDVFPFKVGDDVYVRLTYANYSNGKQSQPGQIKVKDNEPPVIYPIRGINGKVLCMLKADYDTITKALRYASGCVSGSIQLASGQLSVPFKLRKMRTFGADTLAPFRMTTDVTIGVYAGPRWRPSWKQPDFFITLPVTAGLTFVNVSNNTTSLTQPDGQVAEIVPGFTWSMGLIFQYRRTNFGFVFGRDYASDYANKWIYHNDPWYSLAIGYSFLK